MDTGINTDPPIVITNTTISNDLSIATPTSTTTSSSTATSKLLKWSSVTSPISVIPCTEPVGPNVPLRHTFLDIFHLLFTTSLLEVITQQTNLYAKQILSDSAFRKFNPITTNELKAYIGFMILMVINNLPSLYDYWKKDPVYNYAAVASKISRDHFKEISRFLHFTDNSKHTHNREDPEYDRLWKVRPVITSITQTYLNSYNPHHQMSIDEAMIPFKGRSSLKQYIPNKQKGESKYGLGPMRSMVL